MQIQPLVRPLRPGGAIALIRQTVWKVVRATFAEEDLKSDTTTGTCHCGTHIGRFPRCKFAQPRHIGDVLWNVEKTGFESAGRFASVSAIVDHFADDDVVSLGCGAGACILGWEYHRGAQIQRLIGVEVEPHARRVVRAIFPSIELYENFDSVPLPTGGRLVVLTGLVMNIVDPATAARWGEIVARHSGPILWADVGRDNDRNVLPHAFASLRAAGRVSDEIALPARIDSFKAGYRTTATVWT